MQLLYFWFPCVLHFLNLPWKKHYPVDQRLILGSENILLLIGFYTPMKSNISIGITFHSILLPDPLFLLKTGNKPRSPVVECDVFLTHTSALTSSLSRYSHNKVTWHSVLFRTLSLECELYISREANHFQCSSIQQLEFETWAYRTYKQRI